MEQSLVKRDAPLKLNTCVHLKLPNILEPIDLDCVGECEQSIAEFGNKRVLQYENDTTESSSDEDDFCQRSILNSDGKVSDLYKLIMKIPSLQKSVSGRINTKTGSHVKERKKVTLSSKKGRKNFPDHCFALGDSLNSHSKDNRGPADEVINHVSTANSTNRQMMKMHAINLYDSVLPSSLFPHSPRRYKI